LPNECSNAPTIELDFRVKIFAQFIKKAREDKGLSLSEAAMLIGCTKSHLWDMESGRATNPTIKTLAGISAALDMNIGQLALIAASAH